MLDKRRKKNNNLELCFFFSSDIFSIHTILKIGVCLVIRDSTEIYAASLKHKKAWGGGILFDIKNYIYISWTFIYLIF